MSQVSPGWYPDPSGRFVQRYHDGTRWTEHVADAAGRSGVDHVEGRTAPPADPQAGRRAESGPTWGAQGVYGAAAGPGHGQQGYREPPGGESWPAAGAPQAGQGWPTAPQGYGQAGYGPAARSGGFTPTIGLIVAAVGAVLVVLSLFALDFLEVSFAGQTASGGLGDVSGDVAGGDIPIQLDLYSNLGRILGVVVVVGAILAVLGLPQLSRVPNLPVVAAAACGVLALWHLLAMFSSPSVDDGGLGVDLDLDWSPVLGAWVGLLGWLALAAGQFLPRKVGDTG